MRRQVGGAGQAAAAIGLNHGVTGATAYHSDPGDPDSAAVEVFAGEQLGGVARHAGMIILPVDAKLVQERQSGGEGVGVGFGDPHDDGGNDMADARIALVLDVESVDDGIDPTFHGRHASIAQIELHVGVAGDFGDTRGRGAARRGH